MLKHLAVDAMKVSPLAGTAWYLSFISMYGTAIVTTLAVVYGVMQIIFRVIEHRKTMKEKADGGE